MDTHGARQSNRMPHPNRHSSTCLFTYRLKKRSSQNRSRYTKKELRSRCTHREVLSALEGSLAAEFMGKVFDNFEGGYQCRRDGFLPPPLVYSHIPIEQSLSDGWYAVTEGRVRDLFFRRR